LCIIKCYDTVVPLTINVVVWQCGIPFYTTYSLRFSLQLVGRDKPQSIVLVASAISDQRPNLFRITPLSWSPPVVVNHVTTVNNDSLRLEESATSTLFLLVVVKNGA
jgi:hypothetical protein